jgi:hypothetical protein
MQTLLASNISVGLGLVVLGLLGVPSAQAATDAVNSASSAEAVPSAQVQKIPVSMIIDDGAFYVHKIPNAFLKKLGEWAITNGVKGKFSIVPIYGGIRAIDGSLGEYGGTTKEERLEWIETIKTLITPRWTITPEIITHGKPWDLKNRVCMTNMPRESDWLAEQSLETQTDYITESMQLLKNVGIEFGGLTMCWHYPPEKNHILGEATLRAAEKVQGSKFVMIFNDKGEKPAVIYKRADGAMAVSMRPALTDLLDYSDKFTEADIQRLADRFISADGSSGQFVDQIKKGVCLEFYTHYANLYSGGTYKGLEVLTIAIGRLNQFYGDKVEWMTGLEICRRFAE